MHDIISMGCGCIIKVEVVAQFTQNPCSIHENVNTSRKMDKQTSLVCIIYYNRYTVKATIIRRDPHVIKEMGNIIST